MKIKIHSSELNRMMKTIVKCIDSRDQKLGNIEVSHENNLLSIRGTNSQFSAVMSTPVLGGDGEKFCIDGTIFAKVCAMCGGEIEISTDGKTCTVKGAGRTRLPIVNVNIPEYETINGKECAIPADLFSKGYGSVAYAISTDQSRIILTGVLMDSMNNGINMVSLDGFKLAIEPVACDVPEGLKVIVPGGFMNLVSFSTYSGDMIVLKTDGKRMQAETDGMKLACTLLSGEYADYKKIVPDQFKMECLVKTEQLMNALKSGSVVNASNNLVKLVVSATKMTVMSNSEHADFDADIACETNGDGITIAFNQKYLMESISSVSAEEIVMKFNTPLSPCVICGKNMDGIRLVLPVRVAG